MPAEYESLTFPPAKWVVFEVHGPMPSGIIETWKQIYSEWFPSNGHEPADVPALEAYIDDDLTKPDYHAEIWIAIKY